ncbi:MAG: hypothetical protein V7722_07395 [Porticoccus sp.]
MKKFSSNFSDLLGNMGLPDKNRSNEEDSLKTISNFIDNMNIDEASNLLYVCDEARGFNAFVYGSALIAVKQKGGHQDVGFESFDELIDKEFCISKSEAQEYMRLSQALRDAEVVGEDVSGIGWAKLRWIGQYITQGNMNFWIRVSEMKYAGEIRKYAEKASARTKDLLKKGDLEKFHEFS